MDLRPGLLFMTAACRIEDLGQHRPKLVRFARTRLLNPAHAEDAVQDTLLAAIENIHTFSGGSSLFTWLTGILRHKIVDCVRRSARDQWHEIDNNGTPLAADGLEFARIDIWASAPVGWGEPADALIRRLPKLGVRNKPERRKTEIRATLSRRIIHGQQCPDAAQRSRAHQN